MAAREAPLRRFVRVMPKKLKKAMETTLEGAGGGAGEVGNSGARFCQARQPAAEGEKGQAGGAHRSLLAAAARLAATQKARCGLARSWRHARLMLSNGWPPSAAARAKWRAQGSARPAACAAEARGGWGGENGTPGRPPCAHSKRPATVEARAQMRRPKVPSRPTARSGGTLKSERNFSSMTNWVAAAIWAATTRRSPKRAATWARSMEPEAGEERRRERREREAAGGGGRWACGEWGGEGPRVEATCGWGGGGGGRHRGAPVRRGSVVGWGCGSVRRAGGKGARVSFLSGRPPRRLVRRQ